MRWDGAWVVLGGLLLACGNSGGAPSDSPTGGAGETGAIGGTANGGAAGAAQGGAPAVVLPPQPTCTAPAVACNGQCLEPGDSANGCTYVIAAFPVTLIKAYGGDLYYSGTFLYVGAQTPEPGLYRIDGTTLAPTELDGPQSSHLTGLAFDGQTVYALAPSYAGTAGALRSFTGAGGASELVGNLGSTSDVVVRGDRIYYVAAQAGTGGLSTVFWVSTTGGASTPGPFSSVYRMLANDTLLVTTWNGDIHTAPLPDISTSATVLGDFELTQDAWWVDNDYVYWQVDRAYKRLRLDARNATEPSGEVLTTFPDAMTVRDDIGGDMLLTASVGSATGVCVMPQTGGPLQQVGVVGSDSIDRITGDANYVYVVAGLGLLRFDR